MMSGHRRISMREAETRARPAIMRAMEIDDTLAQAHNALAELKYQYEFDWTGAEKEFKRAIELDTKIAWIRQAYGWFLMSGGRFDEANAEMEKARELDPSSLTINVGRGRLFYYTRQYDRAIEHYLNILAVEPNDRGASNALLAVYEQKKMYPEAIEIFLKMNALSPERAEDLRNAYRTEGWEGFLRKQLERARANEARTGRQSPSNLAGLYVRLGEKEKAFFWLEKLYEERDASLLQLKIEPPYDSLHADPRYGELIRKLGLEP